MSVSHMNSHGAPVSRNFRATMFRPWEMFGPDPTASTESTGTGPSMHAASSDAQNSARTVPGCTYPITQWSATARFLSRVQVIPLLDRLPVRRVRVVPVAHHERRALHREPADAPAARLMAVVVTQI